MRLALMRYLMCACFLVIPSPMCYWAKVSLADQPPAAPAPTQPLTVPPQAPPTSYTLPNEVANAPDYPPPDAVLEGPKSGRVGEMMVFRCKNPQYVDYCMWTVDPDPGSLEIVDQTVGRGRNKKVTGPGYELHWSAPTEGQYTVTMVVSGPGGPTIKKQTTLYGTQADGNTTTPAAENMNMELDDSLDTVLIKTIRSVRARDAQSKAAEQEQIAAAFQETADEIKDTHITTDYEMRQYLKKALRTRLKSAFGRWVVFFDTWSEGLSESHLQGQLKALEQDPKAYIDLLEDAAEMLKENH